MSAYTDLIARGQARHGERFDTSELAPQFVAYYHTGQRIKVRSVYGSGPDAEIVERTGTVGASTGWRPAFLLIHRSSDTGSWDVLKASDEIIAVQQGRAYVSVSDAERPVTVSRAQVRAAQELIRLRGEEHVHPVVRQVAGLAVERD